MMPTIEILGISLPSYWVMCAAGMLLVFVFCILQSDRYNIQLWQGIVLSLSINVFGVLGVAGKLEFWLIPLGIVFILETLSVIIQVISFKTTGKRVFKMSPVHHHFELCGWSEKKVVYVFYIIGLIFATAGVIWYIL